MTTITAFDPDLSFEAMEASLNPGFGAWLLKTAQRFAHVDEIYAYRFTPQNGPRALVSTGDDAQAGERAALYANRFHPYDPMLQGAASPQAGFFQIEASQIQHRDYRQLCFEQPRFVDKLSFRWVRPDEAFYVSFYRRKAADKDALHDLAKLAEISLSTLARREAAAATKDQAPLADRLAKHLAQAYPLLTARETEVCARTLAGQTAKEIALSIGVKPSTILTYRQRAYGKYDVAHISDFLSGLIKD